MVKHKGQFAFLVKLKVLASFAILLTGCATSSPPCAPDVVAEVRHPPAECMLPCDPLAPPAGPTLVDVDQAAIGAALNQKECAKRHRCLVEWAGAK